MTVEPFSAAVSSSDERDALMDRWTKPGLLMLAGQWLHFVGIGGSGMSGLVRLVQQCGARCSGSDRQPGPTTEQLERDGVWVLYEQVAASVPAACTGLVISAAIGADHPEVLEARRRGLPVYKYAQVLGRLMQGQRGVAIAGTHGKSSTTAMLSHVLIQAGLDPSLILGARCAQIGGGSRVSTGAGDLLLAEACEYDRSFHHFQPTHAVILNVEVDHLDLYSGIEEIVEAFAVFARRLPAEGSLLVQHECADRLTIAAGLACSVETLGFAPQADWRVAVEGGRAPQVRLWQGEVQVASWISPMPGEHMAYNAAAAAVTAHRLGADWDAIGAALSTFEGLDRRMQRLGNWTPIAAASGEGDGVPVIDDYGHHPTEVDTTLRALRRHYRPQRLVCVFQPHQHSRTRFLMDQFAASFSAADVVLVPEIYFVRDSEQERQSVTAEDLVRRLQARGVDARHLYPFEQILVWLREHLRGGDLLVTMGAGDVWQIAQDLIAEQPGAEG